MCPPPLVEIGVPSCNCQNEQRVPDAKIGRLHPSPACRAPCRRSRRESVRKLFFFFFSLAPQLVQFPVGCRDLSQNEIVSETCVKKKRKKRKEGKKSFIQRKESVVTHAVAVCILLCSNVQMLENRTI